MESQRALEVQLCFFFFFVFVFFGTNEGATLFHWLLNNTTWDFYKLCCQTEVTRMRLLACRICTQTTLWP
jgi:hypothetical protein